MIENEPGKGGLLRIEGVLRSHASVAQLLELDGILVNREIDEPTRNAQVHAFIEQFVKGVSNAG